MRLNNYASTEFQNIILYKVDNYYQNTCYDSDNVFVLIAVSYTILLYSTALILILFYLYMFTTFICIIYVYCRSILHAAQHRDDNMLRGLSIPPKVTINCSSVPLYTSLVTVSIMVECHYLHRWQHFRHQPQAVQSVHHDDRDMLECHNRDYVHCLHTVLRPPGVPQQL